MSIYSLISVEQIQENSKKKSPPGGLVLQFTHRNVLLMLFCKITCCHYLLGNSMTQAIKGSSTWLILGHVKHFPDSLWSWRRQESQGIRDQVNYKWIHVPSSQYLKDCTVTLWSPTLNQGLNRDGTERKSNGFN